MQVYICQNCGKRMEFERRSDFRLFCGKSCAASFRHKQRNLLRDEVEWHQESNGKYACRFNPEGCACRDRKCDTCGHNPEVAQARTERLTGQDQEVEV